MAVEKVNAANFNGKLYQPMVIYNETIRVSFHKEQLAFPFYCTKVFMTPEEAQMFLGVYIKTLVKNGDLPADALVGEKVNEDKLKCTIVEVQLSAIDDEDKK